MLRRILAAVLLLAALVALPVRTEAGHFTQLAYTGLLQLSENGKWEKSYQTSAGEFKIRFRKMFLASDAKRYHLIIWWNGERIADGYCPEHYSGYTFTIFKENDSDRVFADIETYRRAVLFGYDPVKKKLEKYVDSKNYWTSDPTYNPIFTVDEAGDLHLDMGSTTDKYRTQYKLFWDKKANWFGYRDMTVPRPAYIPPPPPAPAPSYSGSSSSAPAQQEVEYEEVYYEGS